MWGMICVLAECTSSAASAFHTCISTEAVLWHRAGGTRVTCFDVQIIRTRWTYASDTCKHGNDCRSERSVSATSKTFCCSDWTGPRSARTVASAYRAEPAGRMYSRPRPVHRQVTQDDVCPLACAAVRLERVHTAALLVTRHTSHVHQSRQSIRLGNTLDIE